MKKTNIVINEVQKFYKHKCPHCGTTTTSVYVDYIDSEAMVNYCMRRKGQVQICPNCELCFEIDNVEYTEEGMSLEIKNKIEQMEKRYD